MKQAGFTLLEVLVTLFIFGLLIAGLSQTVRYGLAAWRTEGRLSDRKTDLEAVDRTLRGIIENLVPGDEAGKPPIDGTNATLTGISRLAGPSNDLAAIPVDVAIAESGNRLVLRWRPYQHVTPLTALPAPHETTLVSGVARFTIAYWQRNGGWVTAWRQPDLPALVRIRVTFLGDNPPHWPDIVTAPLLSRP
jgi:general secretion pathway protein J